MFELFGAQNIVIYVRGHSRSLETAPFDGSQSHTSSYLSSIVTTAVL